MDTTKNRFSSKSNLGVSTLEEVYEKLYSGMQLENKISFASSKTKNKTINMSIGRVWFNLLLPDDFRLVNEPVNKNDLNDLIKEILEQYGPKKATELLSHIQEEAFKLSTISPSSFNIESLVLPTELIEKKKKFEIEANNLSYDQYEEKVDKLTNEYLKYFKSLNLPINNILDGKIKGDAKDMWKTLLISKGFIMDIENNISEKPITKGLTEGFNNKEYYEVAKEARNVLYLKAVAVRDPGYLARILTTANANIKLIEGDCKSKKYFKISVDKTKAFQLLNRYYLEENKITKITNKNIDNIIGKIIKLRSPLYCQSPNGICEVCYGDLAKKIGTINIGILAGGAINGVVVNKMMKARHMSSQIDLEKVDFNKLFEKSTIPKKIINNLFDIQKTKIFAKENCFVQIKKSDYNIFLVNTEKYYIIPSIFNIYYNIGSETEYITLPFNFLVNLYKPLNTVEDNRQFKLIYEKGELIINQEFIQKNVNNFLIINRMFGGNLKYMNKPELLVNNLSEEFPSLDLVHLELIVMNMFRDKDDTTKQCRLTSYKNSSVIGQSSLPFKTSWLNALIFENINKSIQVGLVENKDAEMNPIEKLVLTEDSKKSQ